jgi:AcrR family transcriptional regulator
MGRPRIHDDATRERLLRAAEAMVAEGGVESLSIRRLARAANTTTRAVYSVFGGKDGIVRALHRQSWLITMQLLVEHPMTDDPAEDMVRAALDVWRRFVLEHPNLFRLTFEGRSPELAPQRDDLEIGLATRAELRRRVQRCEDAGLLGGRSADLVTYQFHALCLGLSSNELNGWFNRVEDPRALWEDAFRSLMRGVSQPPVRAAIRGSPSAAVSRPSRPAKTRRRPGSRTSRRPRSHSRR